MLQVVNECYKCGVGEYAEREGQWWCDECPEGYTTGDNGASGPTECVSKYSPPPNTAADFQVPNMFFSWLNMTTVFQYRRFFASPKILNHSNN